MPAVLTAAKNADESVRVAALGTIGTLGSASNLDMLVQTAADAKGAEQKAAQESLYRLKGADTDEAILKKLSGAETKAKIELIRACDQRNILTAVPELMKTAKDADRQVRMESIKAMRNLAGPQDMGGLVELLTAAEPADRSEFEKTIVAVARKIPADKNPAQTVLAALPNAKDADTKSSLMSVIGKIGDPAALPVLKDALKDKDEKIRDAAVRGLSDWPTPAPAEDLLKIAKTSDNQVQKTLALRGYVRLIGLINDKPADEVIKMYKEAMSLAPDASEKRMVLSGLSNLKSVEALQMAGEYLSDAELKQESEAAVVKIAESTLRKNPQETKDMLQKVLAGSPSETVKDQAEKLLKPN
jgi:HEAT repeat protein